jgi:5-methylcytosine-specific restriction endonuclease McrA
VEEVCHVCEKTFQGYLSERRKRQQRRHVTCCSRSCRNVYTSLLLGGDGTWVLGGRYNKKRDRGWPWRKVRLRYLHFVNFTCEGCGEEATTVHHLHQTAAGGAVLDPTNLMAVCKDCHDNMHEQLNEGAFWCSFEGLGFDRTLAEVT